MELNELDFVGTLVPGFIFSLLCMCLVLLLRPARGAHLAQSLSYLCSLRQCARLCGVVGIHHAVWLLLSHSFFAEVSVLSYEANLVHSMSGLVCYIEGGCCSFLSK